VLAFTAARVGAVAKLTFKSLRHDGTQYALRFSEKGGKSREIPVRHDVQKLLLAYIEAAGITDDPFFRTAAGKTGNLTANPMTGIDICRMMKRRLKAAGLPDEFSPHSFRVTTVTDLLEQNTPLDNGQSYCLLRQFCPGFLTAVLPMTCRPVYHSSRNPICLNDAHYLKGDRQRSNACQNSHDLLEVIVSARSREAAMNCQSKRAPRHLGIA